MFDTLAWVERSDTPRNTDNFKPDQRGIGAVNGPGLYASFDSGFKVSNYGTLLTIIPILAGQRVAADEPNLNSRHVASTRSFGLRSADPIYWAGRELVIRSGQAIDKNGILIFDTRNPALQAATFDLAEVPTLPAAANFLEAMKLTYSGESPALFQFINDIYPRKVGGGVYRSLADPHVRNFALATLATRYFPTAVKKRAPAKAAAAQRMAVRETKPTDWTSAARLCPTMMPGRSKAAAAIRMGEPGGANVGQDLTAASRATPQQVSANHRRDLAFEKTFVPTPSLR